MSNYIEGDLETADLLIYGTKSQLNEDLVEEQKDNFMSNMLPDSVAFFTKVLQLQKQIAKNRAIQIAKGAFRKVRSLWNENDIRELTTIGDFQNPPEKMKRYIMAEPTVRALWQKQLCDGYDDYCENNRDKSGEELVEYRNVMNGMILTEDDEYDHTFTIYDDPIDNYEPENKISTAEQFEIFNTWQNLRTLIAKGEEDPTSGSNDWLSV